MVLPIRVPLKMKSVETSSDLPIGDVWQTGKKRWTVKVKTPGVNGNCRHTNNREDLK